MNTEILLTDAPSAHDTGSPAQSGSLDGHAMQLPSAGRGEEAVAPEHSFANLAAICAAMRAQQVHRFEVRYGGSGDSGDAEYPVAYDAADAEMPFDGSMTVTYRRRYRADEPSTEPLEDAVQELLDEVLDATDHGGYCNNEGGGGTLTINASGAIQLDHYDYIIETVDSVHVFAVPTVAESAA